MEIIRPRNWEYENATQNEGRYIFQILIHIESDGLSAYFTCEACCGISYRDDMLMDHIELHKKYVQGNTKEKSSVSLIVSDIILNERELQEEENLPTAENNIVEAQYVFEPVSDDVKDIEPVNVKVSSIKKSSQIKLSKRKTSRPRRMKSRCQNFEEQVKVCFESESERKEILSLGKSEKKNTNKFKKYACPFCKEFFNGRKLLSNHRHTVHTGEKLKYPCETCGKYFTTRNHLNSHMKLHTGLKPFKCDVCSMCFPEKRRLIYHQRMHTDERLYQCEVCGKAYRSAQTLKEHLRVHSGETPFSCSTCSKKFKLIAGLSRHELIHKKHRKYLCDTCGKGFTQNCNLKIHKRIHTGVKPFNCSVCNLKFRVKCTLNDHLKKTHGFGDEQVSTDEQTRNRMGRGDRRTMIKKKESDDKTQQTFTSDDLHTTYEADYHQNWRTAPSTSVMERTDQHMIPSYQPQVFFNPFVI